MICFLQQSRPHVVCGLSHASVSGLITSNSVQASHHHLAALTAAGQVLVWRNRHGNIRTRCDGWEYISDLENKGIVLIDIAGPDIDRRSAGYGPEQEDQVFFLLSDTLYISIRDSFKL